MFKISIASFIGAFALMSIFLQPAKACGVSYTILPDGTCLDLSYLSVIGEAQGEAKAARQEFFREYQERANRYVDGFTTPEGRRWARNFGIRTTQENLELGLDEELEADLEDAALTALRSESIEEFYWNLHVSTMFTVGEAYREIR